MILKNSWVMWETHIAAWCQKWPFEQAGSSGRLPGGHVGGMAENTASRCERDWHTREHVVDRHGNADLNLHLHGRWGNGAIGSVSCP